MYQATDKLYVWASDIDQGTLLQAERTSRLSIVPDYVALMPDAHFGLGATVGSVIPTEGAVIPAAVGVDIGCVDADTEFLAPDGWHRIAEYAGGLVAQYDSTTDTAEFIAPSRYVVRGQGSFLWFKTKYGIDQMLTPDHRVLRYRPTGRDRNLVREVVLAGDHAAEHERLKLGSKALFDTAFKMKTMGPGLPLDYDQLRVQVMVMADGHLDGSRAIVKLRKLRKVERARKLLANAGMEFTEHQDSLGDTTFRFVAPFQTKTYGDFWNAAADQLEVIVEECLLWDRNAKENVFHTRDRASADFMSYAFAATGSRSVLRSDEKDGVLDYRVYGYPQRLISMSGSPKTPIEVVPSKDGKAYCFTVPSGFLVLRRNGHVFLTGNCGMIAAHAQLTSASLPDNLDALISLVEKRIPSGVGKGHDHHGDSYSHKVLKDSWQELTRRPAWDAMKWDLRGKAAKQIGTLGSGNHFFEVCLDENDSVWVVLHSGSRGVGNKLADGHIKVAQALMKEEGIHLEDRDLAYLQEGTPQFDEYIRDLLWAQDYAQLNRSMMMSEGVAALSEILGFEVQTNEWINCHHNFTQKEVHHGREVWLTRKGAIQAKAGQRGVIPGSMGTRSYIVRGLGNAASFESCSHGAGRRMSRGAARRELTADSLREAMAGKSWNSNKADALVDEHPLAYKDIDRVMADQADLVEITHTLHQIANYKGT